MCFNNKRDAGYESEHIKEYNVNHNTGSRI